MTPDLATSQAFYGTVLGWTFIEPREEFGGYSNASLRDRLVAGLMPQDPDNADAPVLWNVYLASDDLDATAAAAAAHDGRVVSGPHDVGDLGRMAIFVDPTGCVVGAWQAGRHTGFEAYDEPGSVGWCDELSPDPQAARTFYAGVWGLTYQVWEAGPDYALFTVPGGESPAGGIGSMQPGGDDDRPGWTVCFTVADVDQAVDVVAGAGGTVVVQPYNFEFGRLAVARGPHGERFWLISSSDT